MDAGSPTEQDSTSSNDCPICFEKLQENKAFVDPCMHQYCFDCVRKWSMHKAVCPLCGKPFLYIIHNVRSMTEYDVHHVEFDPEPIEPDGSVDFINMINSDNSDDSDISENHDNVNDTDNSDQDIFMVLSDAEEADEDVGEATDDEDGTEEDEDDIEEDEEAESDEEGGEDDDDDDNEDGVIEIVNVPDIEVIEIDSDEESMEINENLFGAHQGIITPMTTNISNDPSNSENDDHHESDDSDSSYIHVD